MDWREINAADLTECLPLEPRVWGDEIVGREEALRVWKQWTRSLAFNSAVVELKDPQLKERKVAFGASLFIDSEFMDGELKNPQPRLNSRIVANEASGRRVAVPEARFSETGSTKALDVVILTCNYRYDAMSPEQTIEAEMMLPAIFGESHTGYRLNRILVETVSERQRRVHVSGGVWKAVAEFPECERTWLMLTEKEAHSVSGSIAAALFRYEEPVLRLRDTEKQLLAEAMNGETDAELATKMNLSLATIKKRWASLFDRVAEIRPELLPDAESRDWKESRGPQKRHRILAYVREHPEEVRPFRWGRRRPL